MSGFEMEWDRLRNCWAYLGDEESNLYTQVKDSPDPKDRTIKMILERLAAGSYSTHCRSTY